MDMGALLLLLLRRWGAFPAKRTPLTYPSCGDRTPLRVPDRHYFIIEVIAARQFQVKC